MRQKHTPDSPSEDPQESGAPEPTTEAIAERAYERFLTRGQEPGKDLDDWLEAERELREGRGKTADGDA